MPPSISMLFSLPSAKNPTDRLSGDQNGMIALSVRSNGRAETESRERSHSLETPSVVASNTILRPSGEIAMDDGSEAGGVVISRRISEAGGTDDTARRIHTIPAAAISTTSASDDIHASHSRRDVAATGVTTASCTLLCVS